MDGARQIVTPAFVSLLCICIVFVPMFFPGRRRALPVRADGRSGDVRDDLFVHPVAHPGAAMANYLLKPHTAHAHGEKPPTRNPWSCFSAASRARFERFREVYRDCW